MKLETSKQARLEARIPQEVHAMLKRAAEMEGRTLTDFVVSAASAAARQTIEEVEVVRLSLDAQQVLAEAFICPTDANPSMERAFANRERLLSTE